MKPSTFSIIKAAIEGDDSVDPDVRKAILAFCKNPFPITVPSSVTPLVDRWLTAKEAATLLALSLRTVRRLILSGALPSRKIQGCRRIPASALATEQPPQAMQTACGPSPKPTDQTYYPSAHTSAKGAGTGGFLKVG